MNELLETTCGWRLVINLMDVIGNDESNDGKLGEQDFDVIDVGELFKPWDLLLDFPIDYHENQDRVFLLGFRQQKVNLLAEI